MTRNEKQWKFSEMVARLLVHLIVNGYDVVIGEVKRPKELQELYVKEGRSWTMNSKHLECLAVDLALFKEGKYLTKTEDYKEAGEFWVSIGGRWGGDFNDGNHFEWHENAHRILPPKLISLA